MIQEKFIITTVVTGSDDGTHTFEISRSWDTSKKKALLIALYPTIDVFHASTQDLSNMFFLNHSTEMGLGSVRILNLYSKVQTGKPSASKLTEDLENLAYISEVLEEPDISDYYIILGWGSSLSNHINTINTKIHILELLQEKGLSDNVMQLTTEDLDTITSSGVHPLYLGLHFNRSIWSLSSYPLEDELRELYAKGTPTVEAKAPAKKGRKKKCTTE